jgi:hypothetical protein
VSVGIVAPSFGTWVVYRKLGLALLLKTWFNFNFVWGAALVAAGLSTLRIALPAFSCDISVRASANKEVIQSSPRMPA